SPVLCACLLPPVLSFFLLPLPPPPRSPLFPYTTLFRSLPLDRALVAVDRERGPPAPAGHHRLQERHPVHHRPLLPVASRRGEARSEEHTSELQSHLNLVCRLLLEKKKKKKTTDYPTTQI